MEKTAEQSFEEHFDKFRHGIFRSSLDHFLETGRVSGSLLLSVREFADQFHKQETAAVQDTQEKPDSGWISVKDRLPELNEIVQLYRRGWELGKRVVVGETTLWHFDGETLYTYDAPTHWQPLPESPNS